MCRSICSFCQLGKENFIYFGHPQRIAEQSEIASLPCISLPKSRGLGEGFRSAKLCMTGSIFALPLDTIVHKQCSTLT